MHYMAHVRFSICSCKWLNGELTFQFKVSRGTMTISLILFYSEPWSFTLCLLPNHWNLLKVIGHTVTRKAINTWLYFYFPQGEDTYFFTGVLCKSNHSEYWKQMRAICISERLWKSPWNTFLKYALIKLPSSSGHGNVLNKLLGKSIFMCVVSFFFSLFP